MIMYQWAIELWTNPNGVCYADRDLLASLDSKLLERLFKKADTYTKYPIGQLFRTGDLEQLDGGVHELKFHLPEAEIRYLGCIEYGELPIFHTLHAFNKKSNKIKRKNINTAKIRKAEFETNHEL